MKKTWFFLAIGVVIGYSWGFKDAKAHDQDLVMRTISRIRGEGKQYNNDIDGAMDRLEKR